MNENYIVINGKRAELTKEQLKQLGIEIETKAAFTRVETYQKYYYINSCGHAISETETRNGFDYKLHDVGNYCTNKKLMKQRSLHETLNRLLWRFSCENGELENEWNNENSHYFIGVYSPSSTRPVFAVFSKISFKVDGVIYFPSKNLADKAVETIVKPFIAEHPDFVW